MDMKAAINMLGAKCSIEQANLFAGEGREKNSPGRIGCGYA